VGGVAACVCIVPENFHTTPTEGFWIDPPYLVLFSHFPLKNLAFPVEFSKTFFRVGMDILKPCYTLTALSLP